MPPNLNFTLSNTLELFSMLAPFLLAFFLVMASIFNQDIKGLIYLAGIFFALAINLPLMYLMGQDEELNLKAGAACSITGFPMIVGFSSPSPSSLIIAFTAAYLLLPMIANGQMNYAVLATLLCLLGLDGVTKIAKYCTTITGIILGILVGLIFGATWYTIIHSTGYDSLLYFNEIASNNVQCSKPSKQTFKCSVYKNGQLVSSNIA